MIHTYMSKRKLTKEMADAFVDSIIIHGKYDYEIKLVYDDQFADLQKLKKEKEAQSRCQIIEKQLFTSVYPQKMTM